MNVIEPCDPVGVNAAVLIVTLSPDAGSCAAVMAPVNDAKAGTWDAMTEPLKALSGGICAAVAVPVMVAKSIATNPDAVQFFPSKNTCTAYPGGSVSELAPFIVPAPLPPEPG